MKYLYTVVTLILLVACAGLRQGSPLAFETVVAHDEQSIYDVDAYYPGQESAVFVVHPAQLTMLDSFVPKQQRTTLQNADLQDKLLIAVFQGVIGYANYGVEVQSVTIAQNHMSVHASFMDPTRVKFASPSGSFSAFEIIAVNSHDLPNTDMLIIHVFDQDGNEVASSTYSATP